MFCLVSLYSMVALHSDMNIQVLHRDAFGEDDHRYVKNESVVCEISSQNNWTSDFVIPWLIPWFQADSPVLQKAVICSIFTP